MGDNGKDRLQKEKEMQKKSEMLRLSNEKSNRLTKECLQTALICLMGEKPFEKITVTELVKRSGVSRMAFYRNYNSKEEILREMTESFLLAVRKSLEDPKYDGDPGLWFRDVFSALENHIDILKLLFEARLPIELGIGTSRGTYLILNQIYDEAEGRERYVRSSAEGAFIYVLREWVYSGAKESPEEMAKICCEIWQGHHIALSPDL